MKPRAIVAASFDPIHFGHIDIIKRAAEHFDVTVLVANSSKKTYLFNLAERQKLVVDCLGSTICGVDSLEGNKLTADYAFENGISVIVRGIRNFSDWDYEKMLRDINISQQRGVETYFLSCDPKLGHISSSGVKELFNHSGFIHEYVPLNVKRAMEKKAGIHIIGVTGNIASGKNWICSRIDHGGGLVYHIDMDKLAHHILFESYIPLHRNIRLQIRRNFDVLDPDIQAGDALMTPIERKKLGDVVFANSDYRKKLNEIMYQPLLTLLRQTLNGKKGLILLNAALLTEFNLTHICNNQVIVVTTDEESRIERMKKRGYTDTQIQNRLNSQYTDDRKIECIQQAIQKDGFGKIVKIDNVGNIEHFCQDTYKLVQREFDLL
jgi:pantetheine-phosphate adenylyltransferase